MKTYRQLVKSTVFTIKHDEFASKSARAIRKIIRFAQKYHILSSPMANKLVDVNTDFWFD